VKHELVFARQSHLRKQDDSNQIAEPVPQVFVRSQLELFLVKKSEQDRWQNLIIAQHELVFWLKVMHDLNHGV
jgi:hypothetical protein